MKQTLALRILLLMGCVAAAVGAAEGCAAESAPEGTAGSAAIGLDGAAFADERMSDAGGRAGGATPSSTVAVRWRPLDHRVGGVRFFLAELVLENHTPRPLGAGWRLSFHFVRSILADGAGDESAAQDLAGQGIRLADANVAEGGDGYAIEPLPNFVPVAPGARRALRLLVSGWAIHKGDAPAGFYIVMPGESVARAVHASVEMDAADPKQTTRAPIDVMPVQTPALRYKENRAISRRTLEVADRLLPRPLSLVAPGGAFVLGGGVTLAHAPGLDREAAYLRAALSDVLQQAPVIGPDNGAAALTLALDPGLAIDGAPSNAEGYVLSVGPAGVRLTGADAAGVFHAIQTLRQLVPIEAYRAALSPGGRVGSVQIPAVEVRDAPLFRYRGMSLDVARHFQSKETVMKLLDLLATYKINALHFHLTDDEGWRLEIPGLPELTAHGARRGFDPAEREMLHSSNGSASGLAAGDGIEGKPTNDTLANGGTSPTYQGFEEASLNFVGAGSGAYTTKDFEQILAFAAERHIDVIPEIDMPAHARAAVKAMEHRHRTYEKTDPARANEYRLVDPFDTSVHVTAQGYKDNFVNPCLESTYAFLEKVVRELVARYAAVPNARLTMIHGGGDELPALGRNVWWQGSPECTSLPTPMNDRALQGRFLARWSAIIASTGARMAGWDDILQAGQQLKGFVALPWNNVWGRGHEDDAYRLANSGQPVILAHATNLYLSQAANKDPDEPGSYWANYVDEKKTFEYLPFDVFANATEDRFGNPFSPSAWSTKVRITQAGRTRVLGIEALIFSENVKSPGLLDYFVFPKLLGVAERAWNRNTPDREGLPAAWERFANTLGQVVLPALDVHRSVDVRAELPRELGVNYRIPLPGARLANGQLDANVRLPGMKVEWSADGGATWRTFDGPVAASPPILLRTRTAGGRSSRLARID